MAKHLNRGLIFCDWPAQDRALFQALHTADDIFDGGVWSTLSETSVRNLRYGYGQWLGFVAAAEPHLLSASPATRVTRDMVKQFVESLRRNCTETTVAIALQRLRLTISAVATNSDWDWLYRIERRIANSAQKLPTPRMTSPELYQIGLDMILDAKNKAAIFDCVVLSQAEQFRDGLMIAMLVEAPMRRACFAQLRFAEHVVKVGGHWNIFIPGEITKTGEAQDYEISSQLGDYLDEYVERFWPVFPSSNRHGGLWPYGDRPMTDKMVRRYIRKHTEQRLGVAVSPHGFRRASATFLAEADPANVRLAKDLLGHRTFAMTEKHYIDGAGSRLAGEALANLIAANRAN